MGQPNMCVRKNNKNNNSLRNSINNNSKNLIKEDEIIIGIDFGSSGIAFAYSFLNDKNETPTGGYFEGQQNNNKISTEIILDDNLEKILAFGDDCESFLSIFTIFKI